MVNQDPQNTRAYYERSYTFLLLEQFVDATADFSSAILHDPDHPWPYAARGLAHTALAIVAEEVTDFDSPMRLDPDDDTA